MSKIFETQFEKGSLIDGVSKTVMTPTNVTFKKTEKGQSLFFLKTYSTEQINTNRTLIPETGDFSIEAYINLSNVIQIGDPNFDSYPIISQNGDSFSFYAATWFGTANGNLRLYVGQEIFVGPNVRGKGWKHIILTRNGDNWDLFVDNKLNVSKISSVSIPSANTLIGFSDLGDKRFKGFINKVAIYNHSLSEKERELRFREFLQSQITEKPVRGFELVKPTDLSSEVDNTLKEKITLSADREFTSITGNWKLSGNTNIDTINKVLNIKSTGVSSPASYGSLVNGKKYRLTYEVSDNRGGALQIYRGSSVLPIYGTVGIHTVEFTANGTIFDIDRGGGSGSTDIDINWVSLKEVTGLVAAYNMIPNGKTLVDISGNGNNGTILSGNSSREGMVHSKGNGITVKDGALINTLNYTICGRIKLNDLMASDGVLFSNDDDSGNDIIDAIGFRAGQLSWNYDNTGTLKNGVTNILAVGIWYDFVFTSNGGRTGTIKVYIDGTEQTITTTVFYRSGIDVRIFNRSNTNVPFIGECSDLRIYNYAFTPEQAKAYHNSWIKPVILEDFSNNGVNNTEIKDWQKVSGAFVIKELSVDDAVLKHLTTGTKYLECVTAGKIAIPNTQAYGTWEWDWNKSASTTNFILPVSDRANAAFNAANGYTLATIMTGVPNLIKSNVGTYSNLNFTAVSYVQDLIWYSYKLTRSSVGQFHLYIKGGSFGNTWTLVSTTGGSGTNPVTDNTYTTSNYFVVILNPGDKIANIKFYDGIKQ